MSVFPENYLKKTLASGRFFHAYLLVGQDEAELKQTAVSAAKLLLCEGEIPERPCNSCVSCKTADSGNHPDIAQIAPDKKTTISTEHVRGSVVSAVTVRPYRSKYKVFIIENAGLMGAASQNILLKTLEEPPDYAIFILLAEHEELLLPTVLSRVCVLKMPVSKGNSPDDGLKKAVASILENIKSLSPAEILIKVRALEEYKESAELIPDIVTEWYRDVAVVDALVDIEHATRQTESAGKKLRANTGFQLVMEVLFLNLKRGA